MATTQRKKTPTEDEDNPKHRNDQQNNVIPRHNTWEEKHDENDCYANDTGERQPARAKYDARNAVRNNETNQKHIHTHLMYAH